LDDEDDVTTEHDRLTLCASRPLQITGVRELGRKADENGDETDCQYVRIHGLSSTSWTIVGLHALNPVKRIREWRVRG
jgi:hypothetical protein